MSAEEERINQMVEDIISNAKNETRKYTKEAKQQTQEILEKGQAVAEKEKDQIVELESKTIKELEKQQIASINLQARREILQKKEEEIAKAFTSAEDELKKFTSKPAYAKVLASLIVEAGIAIGGGNLLVKARKADKAKIKELANLAKEVTKKSGTKSSLKLDTGTIDSIGGVIVQLDDESITINNTFEARLEQKYRSIRTDVAKSLFV
ncbi:MAG: V-type ATP synthase subunit E [Candidatus Heimdallarchaeota archaeon]